MEILSHLTGTLLLLQSFKKRASIFSVVLTEKQNEKQQAQTETDKIPSEHKKTLFVL